LDTGIAGDYIDHRAGVYERALAATRQGIRVGIGIPSVGELFTGIEMSSTRERNKPRLLRGLGSLFIWPFDYAAAQEFGRLMASLRRMGRPMQQIDVQIAAIASSLGNCTVVSSDSDLFSVPGLSVENWVE
jgi:tRNA(fMet)-specific endonuclease VapC